MVPLYALALSGAMREELYSLEKVAARIRENGGIRITIDFLNPTILWS